MSEKRPVEWLYVATKYDDLGNIVEKLYEPFTSTFSDYEVLSIIAPAIVDDVFVSQRGFEFANVHLFKIFRAPIGITEEDE